MAFSAFASPFQQQQQQQQQQIQQQEQHQQQQQQIQQQQQQFQLHLFTNERTPVTYQTKWADIHPDSQKHLLQIEERILEYRDESQRLDQCVRLYDTLALNEDFEHDAARILQELGGNSMALEREKVLLRELTDVAKGMLRNAEVAVRSFMILRSRFIRPAAPTNAPQPATSASVTTFLPNSTASQMSSSTSMIDFYSGIPTKPSPFLQQTVAKFERQLGECRQWIEELERLLLCANDETGNTSSDQTLLQSLPSILCNIHNFFIHVAAKVENLHQKIESMRAAYLTDQRRRGDESDPFLEADRRELAKREAAARRVHPALHAAALYQPSTQVAGLFTSSPAPASGFSGMSHSTLSSQGAYPSSSGLGFSMANVPPSSSSSSSSFLLSTPTTSATGSSLFGSSTASQTQTMFGSSQTSSLFGANTSSSIFPSTTAAASSSSVFSMTTLGTGSSSLFGASSSPSTGLFAGGVGTASGSSFGTNTKTAKPKPRTSRR